MQNRARCTLFLAALSLAACGDSSNDGDSPGLDSGVGFGGDAGMHDASAAADTGTTGTNKDAGNLDLSDAANAGDGSVSTEAGAKVVSSVAGGLFMPLMDAGAMPPEGAALLVRTVAGHSLVSVQVSGLDASVKYPAHVHAKACSDMMAGGHYLINPDAGMGEANEVWPSLMTDDAGQARSYVDVSAVLRDDAKSIVVHDPFSMPMANAKLLCADLTVKDPYLTMGTATAFPDAGFGDAGATGKMTRGGDGTTMVELTAQGLAPSTMYLVHVHDQPCAYAKGGGHYVIDPDAGAGESNEIWLNFVSDATGAAQESVIINGHTARAEAQSIVIHAKDATRLACISLR